MIGKTDGAVHPAYQTKWLKFGLRRLGLDDPFVVPDVADSYAALAWWDRSDEHAPALRLDAATRQQRPALAWAEAHFFGDEPPLPPGLIRNASGALWGMNHFTGPYPLTWETGGIGANHARPRGGQPGGRRVPHLPSARLAGRGDVPVPARPRAGDHRARRPHVGRDPGRGWPHGVGRRVAREKPSPLARRRRRSYDWWSCPGSRTASRKG